MQPDAPELGRDDAAARMRPLLRRARELGAHLHVDMESLDTLEATTDLVFDLLAEREFREGPSTGVVLQAYLRDSPAQLERVLEWARATPRGAPLAIRLVKGAYWDHEIVEARQHGWTRARLRGQGGLRSQLRGADAAAARRPPPGPRQGRLAQPALGRPRHRLQPAERRRRRRSRASGPARARRRAGGGAAGKRPARSRVLPGGGPRGRDGLPRPPAAREHLERVVPARPPARDADRGAAGGAALSGAAAVRQRADAGAAPRAGARGAARRAARARPPAAARGAGAGLGRARRRHPASTPPTRASRIASSRARGGRASGTWRAAVEAARRGAAEWGAPPGASSGPRSCRPPPSGCASAALELAALQVRECAKPWAEADADVCEAIDFLEYYARGAVELERGRELLQVARRAQHDALRAARGGRRDLAVELPARHPRRDDRGRARRRQRRRC